jgi:undecaprenyl-diphosphatase
MSAFEGVILGIIQGLTEFLPISSTGHLLLGRWMIGLQEAGLFLDTMLHVGTLFAVMVYYRRELWAIVRKPLCKLSGLLLVGTIPAVIVGFAFESFFDELAKSGATVGWEFLVTGLFLWWAETLRAGKKRMDDINVADALVIGSFQAAAIFPAISRSGLTIVGALVRKFDRETAAHFSFLLSIPAIAGAIVLQMSHLVRGDVQTAVPLSLLIGGTIASAVAGYIAVRWMIGVMKRGSLRIFAIYVWILGAVILGAQAMGRW